MNKRVIIFWASCIAMVVGWSYLVYLMYHNPANWLLITVLAAFVGFIIAGALQAELCLIETSEYRILEQTEYCATKVSKRVFLIQQAHDDLLRKEKYWHTTKKVEDEQDAMFILSNIKNGMDPRCHTKTKVLEYQEPKQA